MVGPKNLAKNLGSSCSKKFRNAVIIAVFSFVIQPRDDVCLTIVKLPYIFHSAPVLFFFFLLKMLVPSKKGPV